MQGVGSVYLHNSQFYLYSLANLESPGLLSTDQGAICFFCFANSILVFRQFRSGLVLTIKAECVASFTSTD